MRHIWLVVLLGACGSAQKPAPAQNIVTVETESISTTVQKQPTVQPAPDAPPPAQPDDGGRAAQLVADEHAPPVAQVEAGTPPPAGTPDKETIRTLIKTKLENIQYCYEKRLVQDPSLKGTTMVKFVIGTDGFVTEATGSGFDPEVDACVAKVIKERLRFPGGSYTGVNYPFTFQPAP